jgi:uncharacterized protein YdeI (YjbR/CyaY-like superfamily)
MVIDQDKTFYARDRKTWRKWLEANHEKKSSVWLLIYHKSSATPSVYYEEAVEEALCFGWIDSTPNKRDHESRYQYFAKRKTNSKWSKLNKTRVKKLNKLGMIHSSGQAMIDLAKNERLMVRP